VDDYIGRLMAAITNTGLADNSIVLFTSDHGDNLGSHGLYNKNSWIEESIRIPMIISGARGRPGNAHPQVITDTVASLADVAPTLLDRAGIDVPDHMQGRSLFRDPGSKPSDCAFIETGAGIIIRTLTHKYGLRFATSARTASQARPQFFDLSRDPYEMTNLADTGQQAELEAELRGRLIAWDKATPWSDCLP